MFLKKLLFLPLFILLLATPAFSVSLVGIWDVEFETTHIVRRDGFIKKEAHFSEYVIRFRQNGSKLTGDLLGGKGSRGENVCGNGAIEGTINGRRVEFTLTFQGSCCPDEQENFVGEVSDDGKSLTGKFEPADIPKGNCYLEYGDVKATKREKSRPEN